MRKPTFRLAAVAGLMLLLAAVPVAAKRIMSPGFRTDDERPKNVVLIPPHADFVKKKVLMTEQLVAECEALENSASSWIRKMLEDKGYTVRVLTVDEINADPELQETVRQVNDRYDEEWRKLIRKPKKLRLGRYELGDEARRLVARFGADGLLISRIQAVGASKGQKAMAYLLGGNPGYARLDLSVVEAESGRVEAYFFFMVEAGYKSLTTKPDKKMMQVARGALRKYPKSSEILPPKHPSVAEQKADEEDVSEEAVLADLEALLGPEEEAEPPSDDDPQ